VEIQIAGVKYHVLDAKEKITIADSFVVPQNKIGGGNGEAKLFVGNENQELRRFFGVTDFTIPCFLLKRDLLTYLEETKTEYLNPEQPYNKKDSLPLLWKERLNRIQKLPEIIEFTVKEQSQIAGPRVYLNSKDEGYKLIRELSLPNITYISIIKIQNKGGKLFYYFRLFADFFGDVQHPYIKKKEEEAIQQIQNEAQKYNYTNARAGQGEYRRKLLELCPFCPITLISDDRLLIASHIKPWAVSNDFEKTDPKNGFMLTPTFDFLFDRGFLSFTNDRKTILSPFLSNMTYSKLGISDNKLIQHLPINGREEYLDYHRSKILKK
jgi:putative restriction endonuclease